MSNKELEQDKLNEILSEWQDDSVELEKNIVWGEVHSKNILIIHLGGTTLISDASATVHQICNLMRDIDGNVILDLGACNYLSSLALGSIARLALENSKKGVEVVVAVANEKIKNLIKLLSLNEVLTVFDSFDEAVKYLSTNHNR